MSARLVLSLFVCVLLASAEPARDPRSVEAERYVHRGRFVEAVALFQAVYEDMQKSGVEDERLANAAGDLAGLYIASDRFAEAEPLLLRAIGITRQISGPDSGELAVHEVALVKLYTARRKLDLAERLLAHALPILQAVYGPENSKTAGAINQLGLIDDLRDRLPEAAEHYRQAIRIYEKQTDGRKPLVAVVSVNLLAILVDQHQYAEARTVGQKAVELALATWGPNHPFTARALHGLGTAYQAEGNLDAAQSLYLRALSAWEKLSGAGRLDAATAQASLAGVYAARGYHAKAEALLLRSIATREEIMGPNSPDLGHQLNNLGVCYAAQNRFTEAQRVLERAVALMDSIPGRQSRELPLLNNLAAVYFNQGRLNKGYYAKAEAMYRRALASTETRFGPDKIEVADMLVNLATVCAAEKNFREAKQLEERAVAIRRAVLGPAHPDTVSALKQYTLLLRKSKD